MPQLLEREVPDATKIRDISDVIYIADHKKLPFTSAVHKGAEPTATLVEWSVEKMPDGTTEGVPDEADVTDTDYENYGSPDDVLRGRLQIFQKATKVSRLAKFALTRPGVPNKKQFARSVAKAIIAVKRSIEMTCLSDRDSAIQTSPTTANQMRGLGKWISATTQGDLPVPAGYLTPATSIYTGAIGAINDDVVVTIMQSIYDQTGDSDMEMTLWAGSLLKRQISTLNSYDKSDVELVNIRRVTENAADHKVTKKVDVLDTDFGRVVIRLSSFINTGGNPATDASKRIGYFCPMSRDMLRLRFAEAPTRYDMPDLGGGPRARIEAIGTLQLGNPLCFGKIAATENPPPEEPPPVVG